MFPIQKRRNICGWRLTRCFSVFRSWTGWSSVSGRLTCKARPTSQGEIKNNTNPEKTIIPLMKLLRDEVCDKLNKKVFFRSWMSFDTDPAAY